VVSISLGEINSSPVRYLLAVLNMKTLAAEQAQLQPRFIVCIIRLLSNVFQATKVFSLHDRKPLIHAYPCHSRFIFSPAILARKILINLSEKNWTINVAILAPMLFTAMRSMNPYAFHIHFSANIQIRSKGIAIYKRVASVTIADKKMIKAADRVVMGFILSRPGLCR